MGHFALSADDLDPFQEPILEAVRVGGVAEIDAALALDADAIRVRSSTDHRDALGLALAMGKLDLAAHLIDRGADPCSWEPNDATPLCASLGLPQPLLDQALALLAERGVRARRCDVYAAAEVGPLAVFARVRALPRSVGGEDEDGNDTRSEEDLHASLLAAAARRDDVDAMRAILDACPSLGTTPDLLARAREAAGEHGALAAWRMLADSIALAGGADPALPATSRPGQLAVRTRDAAAARRAQERYLVLWGLALALGLVLLLVAGAALLEWLGLIA